MRLRVVGTGSRGNCYQLISGDESLLLDVGVKYSDLILQTDALKGVCAALVTHAHKDHSLSAGKLIRLGVPVVMSRGAAQEAGITTCRYARDKEQFRIGSFTILPFRTEHDAAEPLGFLIRAEGVTLLYATDTYYVRYRFPGVNWWLIECNYVDELIEEMDNVRLKDRLQRSHMSLSRLKEMFGANDLTDTKGIVLCHLSDARSNEQQMVEEINSITSVPVLAASAGMEVEICR
jgi:phosphoribosyl 1,2-cyclic phosphodiesterase